MKNCANCENDRNDTLITVAKVFLIIGCVMWGVLMLPLAWCIPLTLSVFHNFNDRTPIGTGMKICILLFVSVVAGICLLCLDESKL